MAAVVAVFYGSCGDDVPIYDVVLTSPHFRLFVHNGATPAANALLQLEEHYRDTKAYLGFPEVVIDYHLFLTREDATEQCWGGAIERRACASGNRVYTTFGTDEHELIHAYMAGVGSPPPLIQEGIATGLTCGSPGSLGGGELLSWQDTVTQTAISGIPYQPGFALFNYLVRRYGIEKFVEYYGRARFTLDPDVFASDFEGFWGISVDTAWLEMVRPNGNRSLNAAICPCTQPDTLVLDGTRLTFEQNVTWFLPLPDADPGPYLFSAEAAADIRNCAQDYLEFPLAQRPTRPVGITATRLLPERHYLTISSDAKVSARKGDFLAATCEDVVPIPIASKYQGDVTLLAARGVADPAGAALYARLTIEGPTRTVLFKPYSLRGGTLTICPACDAPDASCTTVGAQDKDLVVNIGAPGIALQLSYVLEPDSIVSATMTFQP
ncbi:MAG: hypothetical protein ABI560_01380 [Myxococcales bacterium]